MHLSYTKDFHDAFMGNFVAYHRGTANLNQRFGTMLDVTAYANLTYGVYGQLSGSNLPAGTSVNQGVRQDVNVDAGLKAHFEISRMFSALLSYRLRAVFTNFKVVSSQTGDILDVGSYNANELMASVSLRY